MKNTITKKLAGLFVAGLLLTSGSFSFAAGPVGPENNITGTGNLLTDYVTSWIANDGGTQRRHVPHTVENMFVRRDGVVATICEWDEGGTNVAVFKNGELISVPELSGTGGWGRMSCTSVVLDDDYVYQLLRQHGCDGGNSNLNTNKLPQYPMCDNNIEWKTIRRYNYLTGASAPFSLGYGFRGDMLLICDQKSRDLVGLAITPAELYVAVTKGNASLGMKDSIKVYRKSTMSSEPTRTFAVEGGVGRLHADNKQGLWMLQGNKIIRMKQQDGTLFPQSITLPPGVNAQSFSVDYNRERILVANSGEDLNILIYTDIFNDPKLTDTFGETKGIFSSNGNYKRGQVGPMRFTGPCGVGIDDNGVIYVANTYVSGGLGASVEAYKENTGEQLWQTEGLVFTATADFDRTVNDIYYTPDKIHKIDFQKLGDRIDETVAYTADPFRYPKDIRYKPNGDWFVTSVFKYNIESQSILFVSNMTGSMIAGYRFNETTDGYIAIPFMWMNDNYNTRTGYFWHDTNGNGQEDAGEIKNFQTHDSGESFCIYADSHGNIYRGQRSSGFSYWKMTGITANGVPQYGSRVEMKLPSDLNMIRRIYVDGDDLYMTGFSNAYPGSQWTAAGTTIVKYKNGVQKINAGITDVENWTADLVLYLKFAENPANSNDEVSNQNTRAIAVEGDYIFCSLYRNGVISVFDKETGDYKGYIRPGIEVGSTSGWTDFNYAINARKNEDGSYSILNEENAYAKVVHYDLVSFSTDATLAGGDLRPKSNTLKMINESGIEVPANTTITSDDKIGFKVTVENNSRTGNVVKYNRYSPSTARCIVSYKVSVKDTGVLVYEGFSTPHVEDILPRAEIDMQLDEFVSLPAGDYRLEIDVNYNNHGKETLKTNNTSRLDFSIEQGTSIEMIEGNRGIQVYPVPVKDVLNIDLGMALQGTVTLNSIDGKTLISQPINGQSSLQLNVSGYTPGAYILQIVTSEQSYRKTIMIN